MNVMCPAILALEDSLQNLVAECAMTSVRGCFLAGMAVTAGQFFGSKIAYAAGAPRANGTGQVVIFTKKRPTENPMDVQLILSGEQFASSFGYELTNADINGDGYGA
jgi:hypothetical protein